MIVIFDLDGTLVDTYPVIRKTLIELFALHLPSLKYDELFLQSFFGPTLQESFYSLTKDQKQTEFLISEYRKINSVYYEKELKLFPGVIEALREIEKKHKLVILSNRIQRLVDIALKETMIEQYFDLVLGVDNIPNPKPSPDGIYKILNYYKEKNACFIGDAISDVLTAKNANVISIGTTWALTTKKEFEEVDTDYVVRSYDELLKLLEEINV